MRIPLTLEALPGHSVVYESASFGQPTLIVDGKPHKAERGVFTIERPGQEPLAIRIKTRIFDPIPNLEVDGVLVSLAPPLALYEYIWCCLPILLVTFGGAIGGAIGAMTCFLNVAIFRALSPSPLRYLATIAVTLAAGGVYFVLALALTSLMS